MGSFTTAGIKLWSTNASTSMKGARYSITYAAPCGPGSAQKLNLGVHPGNALPSAEITLNLHTTQSHDTVTLPAGHMLPRQRKSIHAQGNAYARRHSNTTPLGEEEKEQEQQEHYGTDAMQWQSRVAAIDSVMPQCRDTASSRGRHLETPRSSNTVYFEVSGVPGDP
jgi:hypothetical protein